MTTLFLLSSNENFMESKSRNPVLVANFLFLDEVPYFLHSRIPKKYKLGLFPTQFFCLPNEMYNYKSIMNAMKYFKKESLLFSTLKVDRY
jgi:hypothetical protein